MHRYRLMEVSRESAEQGLGAEGMPHCHREHRHRLPGACTGRQLAEHCKATDQGEHCQ